MRGTFMQMYIVLGLLVFMIAMFFTHKVPYGVTTMTCCVMLALTGVFDISTAFSGLANKTTILIACMFTVAYAFGKTSLINKVRNSMERIKGKSGLGFIVFLFLVTIVLSQLMGRTAIVSIVALFLVSLDDKDEICASRMIFAAFAVMAAWSLKFPVGLGATMSPTANAYYEGIISNPALMLLPGDFIKVSFIPATALTIYALFAWKSIPRHAVNTSDVKEVKETAAISRRDEIIINIVFIGVLLGFIFGAKIGSLMYVIPAAGVLVLLYTKTLTAKETVDSLTGDMVWMIAGVLVMSDAIGRSGVGDMIGNGLLVLLGDKPSGIFVLFVFAVTAIVMTTFMSNTGTAAVLTPIAASLSMVAGMDPRGIVLIINIASIMAIAFPSGSAECALAFAIGQHEPGKLLKFTLPYLLIAVVTLVISASIFFPVYPA
ncbi:TRAP transporter large permease subunit [Enterocloster aldensis]|uniref:TRAP transporter large permease subunit n=3 Tax=Lachnospiraceae TaxID=186803 RepID=A0ABX2HQ56_9FIRM|nr:TRAP transporter large permease subunit [Enterocloster citroniae]MBS1460134.1 TRAP transporter large permease subunit [Clostridium sp.]MBS5631590.1 anion permease [Clostridiales bacterium]NSJ51616.1 TRAP transporter large permease subunit [Enterocloster aldenensis]RGC59742.1 TRAP transporter large permease subunit [Dorea longicatena]